MGRGKRAYVAVFGNIGIVRAYCSDCDAHALVVDGKLQCCDKKTTANPSKWKRECEPEFVRRLPSMEERRKCLWRQDNCCFYCERPFGSTVAYKTKTRVLEPRWDHFMPFDYCADNSDANFVAACQICNGIKSDSIFQTIEEARIYIASRNQAAPDLPVS